MIEKCFYCEIQVFINVSFTAHNRRTRDHIIPRSRGGTNHSINIIVACQNCNNAKSDLLPEEFAQRLFNAEGLRFHQKPKEEVLKLIYINTIKLITKIEPYRGDLYKLSLPYDVPHILKNRRIIKTENTYFKRLSHYDKEEPLSEILAKNTRTYKEQVNKEKNNAWVYHIPDKPLSEQEYRSATNDEPSFHYP